MPERKFQIGDIVRLTPEGVEANAVGWQRPERLIVTKLSQWDLTHPNDPNAGAFMIGVRCEDGTPTGIGLWREKWYEYVGGPW